MTGGLGFHFALLLAMTSLKIPDPCHVSEMSSNRGLNGYTLFIMILILHILNTGSKFLNTIELDCLGTWKQAFLKSNKKLKIMLNWFHIIVFSEVSYGWVFTKTDESADCSKEDTLIDWQQFKFFMHIECMFFIANLFGAILFMIFRSMAHN